MEFTFSPVDICINLLNALTNLISVVYNFLFQTISIPGIGDLSLWGIIGGFGFVALVLYKLIR